MAAVQQGSQGVDLPFLPPAVLSVGQVCGCLGAARITHLGGTSACMMERPALVPAASASCIQSKQYLTAAVLLLPLQVSFCLVYLWVVGLYIYSVLIKRSRYLQQLTGRCLQHQTAMPPAAADSLLCCLQGVSIGTAGTRQSSSVGP